MTKEQEAQAECMHGLRFDMDFNCYYWHNAAKSDPTIEDIQYLIERCSRAESIVDSQAQKIKEQAETIATNAAYAIELQGKIAEQAKEIEILREAVKYDKYANLARIMKRQKDVSVFTHKKAEALQKLYEFDEVAGMGK